MIIGCILPFTQLLVRTSTVTPRTLRIQKRCLGQLALALGLSLAAPASAAVTQLKVMSFNIWVNGGLSLSNCIEVIRGAGADVVGLQECNAATAQTIATRLGFYAQPDSDSSIVSRYPILANIPTSGGRAATIQIGPGQRVHFFNCHLAPYPYGPYDLQAGQSQTFIVNQEQATRMPALTSLLATMAPFIDSNEPCFLTGDFNAPSHFDYTSFPWPTSLACVNAGLGDSYQERHGGNRKYPGLFAYNEPGITWTPKTAQEPNGVFDRIDFVHYSLGDGTAPIASIELDERNSINPWPSDHRAVLTTFMLTPPLLPDKANSPVPSNGAMKVSLSPTLNWLPGNNALGHAVYFGTNASPELLTNTSVTTIALTNLLPLTAYYWRVDEVIPDGSITGDLWTFATLNTNVVVYEWDFAAGNLAAALGNGTMKYADAATPGLSIFGTTTGTTVPHIGGQPATYLRVPAFTGLTNGYLLSFNDSGPNGGGSYINRYTFIIDVFIPGPLNWLPLFNTSPQNANDADWYVDSTGRIGIGDLGYSAAGVITPNAWLRLTFAADLGAGTTTYYRNGTQVGQRMGGSLLDGRFAIFSDADAGPDLLLFNEGDTSGVYTHELYASSIAFTDRRMSAAEVAGLGEPRAEGIFVRRLRATWSGSTVVFTWSPGANVRLQKSNNLSSPVWRDVPGTLGASSFTETASTNGAFYRLAGL
jgi:endonuclease/exonuclease/phosphatase family metal-dependent hydrolase